MSYLADKIKQFNWKDISDEWYNPKETVKEKLVFNQGRTNGNNKPVVLENEDTIINCTSINEAADELGVARSTVANNLNKPWSLLGYKATNK